MNSYLTQRDTALLECLVRQLPFLSFPQIVRTWWPSSVSSRAARRRMRFLRRAGLLNLRIINAPCISVRKLAAWQPADLAPDAAAISAAVRQSFDTAFQPIEVYEASKLAANCFGCSPWRLGDVTCRSAQLLLAGVFVLYRESRPETARGWVTSRNESGRSASAIIHDGKELPCSRVFSVVTSSQRKLESIHERCREAEMPYELWGGAA